MFNESGVLIARDRVREPLYAIVPYFNPWRWKSRVKHTERAIKHFVDSGATVVLVEVAFNRRDFVFHDMGLDRVRTSCAVLGADAGPLNREFPFRGDVPAYGAAPDAQARHMYIPVRTTDELWLKENAINLGVSHLPHDWKQVCWLDSDVHFLRPNWVGECIQKLQHYAFLQMFSHARDLGPNYEMLPASYPHADGIGFVDAWIKGLISETASSATTVQAQHADFEPGYGLIEGVGGERRVWPGLAWACTRKAWDDVGGLFDAAIWGGGDWHMAHALIEKTEGMMRQDLHRNYKKMVMQWYYRCKTHIRRNVGVMEGSIVHSWHGRKEGRGYNTKHALLADIGFDPLRHLKRDYQGLYQLHDDRSTAFVQLRDLFRKVAAERNEDSIDI